MTNLLLITEYGWMWFCIASGVAFALTILMQQLGKRLETTQRSLRHFSILDLEFPSNRDEIPGIIRGIYGLPGEARQQRVLKALKGILYLDFLFMPAAYGAIFLLCILIADKLGPQSLLGRPFFQILAWAQLAPLVFDIAENLLLLPRTGPEPKPMSTGMHRLFVAMVGGKWIIAIAGLVVAAMMILYFWLKGAYGADKLVYLVVFVLELATFAGLQVVLNRKKQEK